MIILDHEEMERLATNIWNNLHNGFDDVPHMCDEVCHCGRYINKKINMIINLIDKAINY